MHAEATQGENKIEYLATNDLMTAVFFFSISLILDYELNFKING